MIAVKQLSRLSQDYLASFLRSQLVEIQDVLRSVENINRYDDDYILVSMKRIEYAMRRFRKRIM